MSTLQLIAFTVLAAIAFLWLLAALIIRIIGP